MGWKQKYGVTDKVWSAEWKRHRRQEEYITPHSREHRRYLVPQKDIIHWYKIVLQKTRT